MTDYSDTDWIFDCIDTIRSYEDYIPTEAKLGEPENERFAKACDTLERAVRTCSAEDFLAFKEEQESARSGGARP